MVGPTSSADRGVSSTRLKAAIVALIGGSAGLVALQSGASLLAILVTTVAGLLFGGLLLWYLIRISP